jgi:tRNA C32,U32 (ribose-2'-O)-methylase TrmJ
VKNKYDNSTLKEYLAEHGVVDHLYVRISSALEFLEYIPRGDKNLREKIITNLKHFIGRAGLTEWEINMLQGICTQIEKKVVRR